MKGCIFENYVFSLQFAGVVPDVQIDDLTNRTNVLRIIDKGKVGQLGLNWQETAESYTVFNS